MEVKTEMTLSDAEKKISDILHSVVNEDSDFWVTQGQIVLALPRPVSHESARFEQPWQESSYGHHRYKFLVLVFKLEFYPKAKTQITYSLACFQDGGKKSKNIPGVQVLDYLPVRLIVKAVIDRAAQIKKEAGQ